MIAKIILLCLMFGAFTINCVKHGEDRGKYNAGSSFISIIIEIILLYYAGFFN